VGHARFVTLTEAGVQLTFSSACVPALEGKKAALFRIAAEQNRMRKIGRLTCTCCGRQERDEQQQQQRPEAAAFAGRTNHRHRQKCTNNPLDRIKQRAHHRPGDADEQINFTVFKIIRCRR